MIMQNTMKKNMVDECLDLLLESNEVEIKKIENKYKIKSRVAGGGGEKYSIRTINKKFNSDKELAKYFSDNKELTGYLYSLIGAEDVIQDTAGHNFVNSELKAYLGEDHYTFDAFS